MTIATVRKKGAKFDFENALAICVFLSVSEAVKVRMVSMCFTEKLMCFIIL